jgi:hypothetical protein
MKMHSLVIVLIANVETFTEKSSQTLIIELKDDVCNCLCAAFLNDLFSVYFLLLASSVCYLS